VTIEETAEAMLTLLKQGKIRAIGVSNYSVLQMERFRRVAPLHVLQPSYNLFEREIEADLLPYLLPRKQDCDARICCALPGPVVRANEGKHGFRGRRFEAHRPEVPRISVRTICGRRTKARSACSATSFRPACYSSGGPLDARPGHHHGIVGARHPGQLQPVDDVAGWSLDASAKAEIDRILRETITDPVGPEFMARRRVASRPDASHGASRNRLPRPEEQLLVNEIS
jgi:hypothetical protein